jgi:hypothetical protein
MIIMAIVSLSMSDDEIRLLKDYIKLRNISISDFIKENVLDKIESEVNLSTYNQALKEYNSDKISYSHDDVKEELGI